MSPIRGRAVVALLIAALSGCAMSPRTSIAEVTSGQYELTKRSGFLVTTKSAELKFQAEQEALQYCAPRGGKLSILDSRATDAQGTDFASASVLFRCG